MQQSANEAPGEARGSGLWGTGRGGRGSGGGRNQSVRRGLLVLLALALAAPLAASAGGRHGHSWKASYLAPSLERAATQTPDATLPVIVQSSGGAGDAASALSDFSASTRKLPIVGAAAGEVVARDLPTLAQEPNLVITPDQSMVFDAGPGKPKPYKPGKNPHQTGPFSSDQVWPAAVGVDQIWPHLPGPNDRVEEGMPTIAFVDTGIEASRSDFGNRVLADVNLTTLPGNSPGDGRGHGTIVAGIAAGSAPGHAGAAPAAGIVSLDVMDDQGMARTSDVIAAAQWILKNRKTYDIRVANFSLHSASASSFRWDPLDKAVEKLWLSGVVVVAASGNQGQGGQPTPMAYAPGNDPFAITVGALDLHGSTVPERADVPPWSAWGYTLDGFAKPELSAPGRAIVGPVPADSTLAAERPGQLLSTPEGTYMTLSGTSLSAPIVAGIAADLLTLRPGLTPDQVKGALMHEARNLPKVRTLAAGVGEAYAPDAAALALPPNPNLALDGFLIPDPAGDGQVFDDVSWLDAAKASASWDAVSWLEGWADVSWSNVSWSDVSWSDVSWADVSWSDVSWADVSWSDVSWADVTAAVYRDVG
ncbi:MAG TPA: S8 family serine peptidase [Gaiellaceae bacterium]|nr:S8 family serine peptidase [Gaiellaceae bacterium]